MKNKIRKPNYLFSISWEVCNKVGGIYTVLSTQAKTLQERIDATLVYIGPLFSENDNNPLFIEDDKVFADWQKHVLETEGMTVKAGRWNIPGKPLAFLVDSTPYYKYKNEIYSQAWNLFQVDSLHAYGDYDEASMFSYAAAMAVKSFYDFYLNEDSTVIYHAHEWMTGLGALFIKHFIPQAATLFTTHATSIGRSICGNNKLLYEYFEGYNGDQMARELNMESKHSIEKQTAHLVDCFTTVSDLTSRECTQLLEKTPHVVTVNGFENGFLPSTPAQFDKKRKAARKRLLTVANRLTGATFTDDTVIVGIGGRYEFRNKGLDMFIESLKQLRDDERSAGKKVLAYINVPGWVQEPRMDLQERVNSKVKASEPLSMPVVTHWLHNMRDDRLLNAMAAAGFKNDKDDDIKVILAPCYLDGNDGIFNMTYYDLLIGQDIALYPSYYEPWGYTPLESAAFRVPTITTDLAGFGLWVNSIKKRYAVLKDGVEVIHRTDNNYFEAALQIKEAMIYWLQLSADKRDKIRTAAGDIAEKALWTNFITYYEKAYKMAVANSKKRK
ncbi:MAG: glycogen/starch synthase [Bacteroidaceae bacterium]|nr:glycogen/starch synthase [Bacteroidaceae bacterium]